MCTVIYHATYNCNASCLHCGVSFLSKQQVLKIEGGIQAIKQCVSSAEKFQQQDIKEIVLILHGGEPLIVGIDYYRELLNKLEKEMKGKKIKATFQSNLLLYNEKWHEFCKEYGIRISTSYDFFSNFRQLKNSNKSYFDLWKDKVKLYQDLNGIKSHVICVMSKENKNYAKEIIDMSYELNVDIKLNPLYLSGNAEENCSDLMLTPEEYGEILVNAYNQWQKHRTKITFVQGEDIEDKDTMQNRCPYSGRCAGYIFGVSPFGIANCGEAFQRRYKYSDNFILNVDALTKAIVGDALINEECYTCNVCGGGCRMERNKITRKYYWCKSLQMLNAVANIKMTDKKEKKEGITACLSQ